MSSEDANCEYECSPNLSHDWRVIFIFLNSVAIVIALGGNAIILLSIYKVRSLRTTSNIFIVSLAAADLVVVLLINPTYIALTATKKWFSSHALYKMENFLWIQCLVTSTFTLCAVSIDRLIAVTSAMKYKQIVTKRRCCYVVVSIWTASLVFGCSPLIVDNRDKASIVWILCLVLTFIIPFVIIIYCYVHIFRAACDQKVKISSLNPAEAAEMLKNRKAAWTAAIVIGLFFVTFFPNVVFSCLDLATEDDCEKNLVYRHWLWGILLAFSSSACNPFVYAARIGEFRRVCKTLLCNFFRP